MVKVNVIFTSSKILAYIIVFMGFYLELKKVNPGVFYLAITAGTGLLINKQWTDKNKPDINQQ